MLSIKKLKRNECGDHKSIILIGGEAGIHSIKPRRDSFSGNRIQKVETFACPCVVIQAQTRDYHVGCILRDPEQADCIVSWEYKAMKYNIDAKWKWNNQMLKTVTRCSSCFVLLLPCFTNDADMLEQKRKEKIQYCSRVSYCCQRCMKRKIVLKYELQYWEKVLSHFLYFARKIGNGCSDLQKRKQRWNYNIQSKTEFVQIQQTCYDHVYSSTQPEFLCWKVKPFSVLQTGSKSDTTFLCS